MTLIEAKTFLEKMATNWQLSAEEQEAFSDWQRHASPEDLKALDKWHRQFLSMHHPSLDVDTHMLNRSKNWLHNAIHSGDQEELNDHDQLGEGDVRDELKDLNVLENRPDPGQQEDNKHYPGIFRHRLNFRHSPNSAGRIMRIAALLLLTLGGLYILQLVIKRENPLPEQTAFIPKSNATGLTPGANRATLTLANGTQIFLDSTNQRVLQFQNGNSAKNLNGNLLAYNQLNKVEKVERNQLTTPRGGQYQIQLPDGTHVWLNSASSLVYPTAFVGAHREVQLTGEAYFEVAHRENQPFIVHTRQMDVKVLGTGFNVMAYPEEEAIRTTLVHGSVIVENNAESTRIIPGQQAILANNQTDFKVAKVDIAQETAWKDGEFWFKNTAVQHIMRQLSRWYNFKVVYQGDISGIRLSGVLAKQQNAEQLLTILQSTRQVQFEVHEQTITVRPYHIK